MNARIYDLIILGGGPAGMTAAIYAARASLRTIILESNITGGLVNSTYSVENFPSWKSVHGMELTQKMREQVDALGIDVEEVCEVEELRLTDDIKTVCTSDGDYQARAVILATGRAPVPLETPTEAEEVHYCAVCDGAGYAGKRVLVVGSGNSAFDESLFLLRLGVRQLTIIGSHDVFFAAKQTQDMLFKEACASGRTHCEVKDLVAPKGHLTAVLLKDTRTGDVETLPVDGIFVFRGQKPNNALFAGQIELSDGYIITDKAMRTNLTGVFAAGDIVDKQYRQIITACADGAIAALSAEAYLRG